MSILFPAIRRDMSKGRGLGLALATLALMSLGACIEAAPFSGGADAGIEPADAQQSDGVSDAGSASDAIEPDAPNDGGPTLDSGQPDGQGTEDSTPDGPKADTPLPCDETGCPCSENDPCAEGLSCYEGMCCAPSCSDGAECGSDGCGGDCGSCDDGLGCTPEQTCEIECEAGASVCGVGANADVAYICDGDGWGYDPTVSGQNCAANEESCVEGACVCVPDCSPETCSDDGESDGCNGVCPSTCGDDEFCDAEGQCAEAECVAGEVFCHEGQPYLCQGNTISGSLALGPVVNCGVAGCVIQDFGELQELEALDDYDKYCGCSEPQHCLDDEHLHVCGNGGVAAILPCADGKVCDDTTDACVVPSEEGDATCCIGKCGGVSECGGICACQEDESCADDGHCYGYCDAFELGQSHCADDTDKVLLVCESGTPPGLSGAQYWVPHWCEDEEENVASICEEVADNDAVCTDPGDGPEPADSQCCSEHFGTCGFVDECEGVCSCQDSEVYPAGYTCSGDNHCTAPCPGDLGNTQCLDSSALKICTTQGWLLEACQNGQFCSTEGGANSAMCASAGSSEDQYAVPFNVDGLSNQSGQIADHEDLSIHTVNGDGPFSISMWIWGSNFNEEGIQPLLRKGGIAVETAGGTPGNAEWILYAKDKRFYFTLYDSQGVAWYKQSNAVAQQVNGNWNHLVVTYAGNFDPTNDPHKFTKFYLNGTNVTDSSGAGSGSSSASPGTYTGTTNGTKPVEVGFTPLPDPTWLQSAIDDVAILHAYVPAALLSAMTLGDAQCGVDLTTTNAAENLVAYWRFEDIDSGWTASMSLVGNHTMNFSFPPDPWDSPCSVALGEL